MVMFRVFSAVEAQKSKSSMVAMRVGSLLFSWICVVTLLLFCVVVMVRPLGALWLSGDMAFAMAAAVLGFWYSRVIVASNFFSSKLLCY